MVFRITININVFNVIKDFNILYSLRVAKYNKNEFQNIQDLKGTREDLVMLKNSEF